MKASQQCEAEKIIDTNDEVTGNNPPNQWNDHYTMKLESM